MKRRQGFVSNSSTSSFLIYGIEIVPDTFREFLREKYPQVEEFKDEYEDYVDYDEVFHRYNIDIPYVMEDGDYDTMYLGEDPSNMPDDCTMGEFKRSIEEKLKDFNGKCSWISHEYSC
jgi:hypothetical protein